MQLTLPRIKSIIKKALDEDIGSGDITSAVCFPSNLKAEAAILAKESCVVCGLKVVKTVLRLVDPKLRLKSMVSEGQRVKTKQSILELSGDARSIFTGERVALNFLSRLSAIASETAKYTKAIIPYPAKIMDTRKTTPGLREMEKYAVFTGGGRNHRMGLYDQVLIKDNHIELCAKEHQDARASVGVGYVRPEKKTQTKESKKKLVIRQLVQEARKKVSKKTKIEIEVENLNEFKAALEAEPDIIMLDNMSIKAMKEAVRLRKSFNSRTLLEASGRVSLRNVRKIASTGVDFISVGSLTHSVKSVDFSLEIVL